MAKSHGARQQKKVAKQKARRAEKRSTLMRRDSKDPTIRLARAEKWPVVRALVGKNLWKGGLGYLVLARQEAEGQLVFGSYLVDVYCLGVKNAYWDACSPKEFTELVRRMDQAQELVPIAPAAVVKIIQGAVAYADALGFRPHPDFRHAALVLKGIDPTTCTEEFRFGREGKPFYMQGPHETGAEALAIVERVRAAGGHFVAGVPGFAPVSLDDGDDEFGDEDEDEDEDDGDDRAGDASFLDEDEPETEALPPPLKG